MLKFNNRKCMSSLRKCILPFLMIYFFYSSISYIQKKTKWIGRSIKGSFISNRLSSFSDDQFDTENVYILEVDSEIYFENSSAIYYIDKNVLTLNVIAKEGILPSDRLELGIYLKSKETFINNINAEPKFEKVYTYDSFEHWFISYKIEFEDSKQLLDKDNLKVYFQLGSSDIQKASILNSEQKNNAIKKSIICSRPISLENNDYTSFVWWIELMKLSGYERVYLYYSSIADKDEFKKYLRDNEKFINLRRINNLVNLEGMTGVLANLIGSVCLNRLSNSYKYISINDKDEIFLPLLYKSTPNDMVDFIGSSNLRKTSNQDDFRKKLLNSEFCEKKIIQ